MHSVFLESESRSEFRGRLGMAVIAMHTDEGWACCVLSEQRTQGLRDPTSNKQRGTWLAVRGLDPRLKGYGFHPRRPPVGIREQDV